VFVPVRPLQASLIFLCKDRSQPKSGAPEVPTLLANIRLGWIGISGTNTLADYEHSQIAPVKSFMTLGPSVNVIQRLHLRH
jgi:hypothetical protein